MPETFDDFYARYHEALGRLQQLDKFFIVGCAKSGTTWLMNLLHGHPQIIARGEGAFVWRLAPCLLHAFKMFDDGRPQDVTSLREIDRLLALRQIIDGRFLRYWHESKPDRSRVRFLADKTPQHSVGVPQLHALYPSAKFVHIIRDPRDATTSALHHIAKTDARPRDEYIRYFLSTVWPLNVGTAMTEGRKLPGQYLEVRYEDLLADEAGQVTRILGFLGADADDAGVRACLDAGSFEKRSGGRQRGQEDPQSFYRRGVAGDWVNHLPPDIVRACCEKIAPLMTACGYDPHAAATATPAQSAA